jgi:hypothetical protein
LKLLSGGIGSAFIEPKQQVIPHISAGGFHLSEIEIIFPVSNRVEILW